MGRIRTVKPEWVEDEGLLRAGSDARVLSIALLLLADDYGNGRCIPEVLAAQVFPFDAEPSRVFRESLAKLQEMGFVARYRVRKQSYFHVRNWKEHQRVDKPGKPRVPGPDSNGSEWLEGNQEAFARLSREPPETLVPDHDHDHDHDHERERPARENSREPPSQTAAEHPPPERYVRVYRDATGNTDLDGGVGADMDRDQLDALRRMRQWSGGDLRKLRAGFEAVAASADKWLRAQPAHVWARRLGTGASKPAPARPDIFRPPPPSTPEEREQNAQAAREGGAAALAAIRAARRAKAPS